MSSIKKLEIGRSQVQGVNFNGDQADKVRVNGDTEFHLQMPTPSISGTDADRNTLTFGILRNFDKAVALNAELYQGATLIDTQTIAEAGASEEVTFGSINNLSDDTLYTAKVTSSYRNRIDSDVVSEDKRTHRLPALPTGSALDIDDLSFKYTVNNNDELTAHMRVTVRLNGTVIEYKEGNVASGASDTFTFNTNINPDTEYDITIRARISLDGKLYYRIRTNYDTVTTLQLRTTTPTILFDNKTSTSIRAHVTNQHSTWAQLYVKLDGGNYVSLGNIAPGSSANTTFSDLTPSTTYDFVAYANASGYRSSLTTSATDTTNPLSTQRPTITRNGVADNSILISVKNEDDAAAEIFVQFENWGYVSKGTVQPGNSVTHTFYSTTDILHDQVYTIRAKAHASGKLESSTRTVSMAVYPEGYLLHTTCSGYTLIGHYADGSGGIYTAVISENSAECGYTPPVTAWATFDSAGGSPNYGAESGQAPWTVYSPGSPTRTDYTFEGWNPSLPRTISEDTNFTAVWSSTGGGEGGGCLHEDTLMQMWDGTTKLLKHIEVGDVLKGWGKEGMLDESVEGWEDWTTQTTEDGYFAPVTVQFKMSSTYHHYYHINQDIKITVEHPLFIKRNSTWQWMTADKLIVGDKMLGLDGEEVNIDSVIHVDNYMNVITIDVEEYDNYFAGTIPVLIHNDNKQFEPW